MMVILRHVQAWVRLGCVALDVLFKISTRVLTIGSGCVLCGSKAGWWSGGVVEWWSGGGRQPPVVEDWCTVLDTSTVKAWSRAPSPG